MTSAHPTTAPLNPPPRHFAPVNAGEVEIPQPAPDVVPTPSPPANSPSPPEIAPPPPPEIIGPLGEPGERDPGG